MQPREKLTPNQYELRFAETEQEIADAKQLLIDILYKPFGRESDFDDSHDEEHGVKYVIVKIDNKVVGAGKVKLNPPLDEVEEEGFIELMKQDGTYQDGDEHRVFMMYGIAVDKEYRGKGLGTALYEAREKLALAEGKRIGSSLIRPDSIDIYEKRDYIFHKSVPYTNENGEIVFYRHYVYKVFE